MEVQARLGIAHYSQDCTHIASRCAELAKRSETVLEEMEADTSDLDAQIAALQAQRARKVQHAERIHRDRQRESEKILVGTTPTKRAVKDDVTSHALPAKPAQPRFTSSHAPAIQPKKSVMTAPPTASKMSSSLAALRKATQKSGPERSSYVVRSTSFYGKKASTSQLPELANASGRISSVASSTIKEGSADTLPRAGPSTQTRNEEQTELEVDDPGLERDADDLTIINRLQLGPKQFGKDPEGEDVWAHVEPNSNIRLLKRVLPHTNVQDHLYGRYYLPPSLLYSLVRLSRDGSTYDVPVEGDWVTIAVVAERSDVRVSGSKETAGSDDEDDMDDDAESEDEAGKAQGRERKRRKQGDKERSAEDKAKEEWQKRRGPRKYVNLKLVSLPPRSSILGGKAPSGDAILQLLLFESDFKLRHGNKMASKRDDGSEDNEAEREKEKAIYKGGSGGAYEKWCNLTEGSVIALLNPRVLRPLHSEGRAPHPLTLPMALNPTSADSITLIGQARDLGRCNAEQKDGNRCRAWVDLRQTQVCEYHIHAAVSRQRAGRAEFTASTSSFALSTTPGLVKPNQQKGKKGVAANSGAGVSREPGGGATYVVGGRAVRTHRSDGSLKQFGDEHLSEKLGRGRAERKKRKSEEKEAEEALGRLLEKEGKNGSTGAKYLSSLGKFNMLGNLHKAGKGDRTQNLSLSDGADDTEPEANRKRPFDAVAIKRIGFDPSARHSQNRSESQEKRLESTSLLRDTDRQIDLSKPAGMGRSNVRPPSNGNAQRETVNDGLLEGLVSLKDEEARSASDDDLMVDLD